MRGYHQGVPGGGSGDNLGGYCWNCAAAYPWREKAIRDANKLLELHFEIEDWDEATKERLAEITAELSSDSANPDIVLATATWLDQRAGPAAKKLLGEIVKTVGSEALKAYVKVHFGLP